MINANKNIKNQQLIELALRESLWLSNIKTNGINADEFYKSHRLSSLGEISYRDYILNKIRFIQKYTDENNSYIAFKAILLGKNDNYDVPIQFTRYLIRSIKRRFQRVKILLHQNDK